MINFLALTFTIDKDAMVDAGVNTIVGMVTVFLILIFISLTISCFKLIPILEKKLSKKSAESNVVTESIDSTLAQITSNEEIDETDDLELVAVITAAIMEYLGDEAPADGLVVRNIRKRNRG